LPKKKRKSIQGKIQPPNKPDAEPCIPNQFKDNISIYEQENMDLLDTIEGVDYERDQFQRDFPHLASELENANLNYPIDAVRWEDEECTPIIPPPEEPTVESLLRRSKTQEEAQEIIEYLKKRGEITSKEAQNLLTLLKKRGLKAFQ